MSHESKSPQVERRRNLSLAEFKREYLYPGKPVVITDAIDGWKDKPIWTFEHLRKSCGDTPVRIHHYDQEREFTDDGVSHVSLAEYIDGITSRDWKDYPYYLRDNWRLFHEHSALMSGHTVPKYFFDWFKLLPSFLRMPYPRIFLGPKGAVTPLHVDVWDTHAWLSQLQGRKRWVLFSPEQGKYLYDYKVRVESPDLDLFPLYAKVHPVEATIAPGDTIFVPSRWAHWVESLDPAISITYNFMGPGCLMPCMRGVAGTLSLQRLRNYISKPLARISHHGAR
ncbi:MAG: cupin-like domain-containing protein [Gammaproteobacteria bacterium]